MTLNLGRNKFRIQGKILAFFSITPLLLATALIKAPCPVCGGVGTVSSTGMDGVTISNVTSTTQSVSLQACANYRLYTMVVTLTLYNSGTREADGFVDLYLTDYSKGAVLDTEFTVEVVPVGTEVTDTFLAYFKTNADTVEHPIVTAAIEKNSVACKACSGTGKVALNAWPFYNSMKANFTETQRIEKPFVPKIYIAPEH